ncbi:hypothetical protein [Streptomyces sp. E-08]|uniref:hypothetical protein n=1 Tax=Streptomyces sp. E-08 TaxID=3404047 RepID=UPI003CF09B1C
MKWSGSSGPQNVFFHNTLAKQTTESGSYVEYQPYSRSHTIFLFGSDESGSSGTFQHLVSDGMPISDWAGREGRTFTGGNGVDGSRQDGTDSLFLPSFPESQQPK